MEHVIRQNGLSMKNSQTFHIPSRGLLGEKKYKQHAFIFHALCLTCHVHISYIFVFRTQSL